MSPFKVALFFSIALELPQAYITLIKPIATVESNDISFTKLFMRAYRNHEGHGYGELSQSLSQKRGVQKGSPSHQYNQISMHMLEEEFHWVKGEDELGISMLL